MTASDAFDVQFTALMGFKPFCWQRRLFHNHFLTGDLPPALDLPTGLGKTSVITIWYLAWKAGAPVPRRLVYVVDRRAVVDQATDEAEKIEQRSDDPDLRISTLRGKLTDNRKWLEDPVVPAIIVGTVDMIGSRLLFEGYGVSRGMRPYHAGLLGADTLVVLDESHLVPPFERLLEQIAQNADLGPKRKTDRDLIPRFHVLPLSATGRHRDDDVFRLTKEDQEDPIIKARLNAKKRLTFEPVGDKKLEKRLAEEAWALSGEGKAPVRILIYCNSRDVAENTKAAIEKLAKPAKLPPENFQLFVGARRVKEREDAKKKLEDLGFFSGNDAPEKPAFVVATSAGEVGVDLDADHTVMDIVSFERMVQRLGRVNRLGGKDARVVVVCEDEPKPKKADTPTDEERRAIIAWRAFKGLEELPRHEDGSHDASPGALGDLKGRLCENVIVDASSPDPLYPALTRPLVDAWSMTSLKEHTGRPEVHPWLRGWVEDVPETTLVWRKLLPVRVENGTVSERGVADFFAAAPPHLTEKLETRTDRVHKWLLDRAKTLAEAIEKAKAKADADSAGDEDVADTSPLDAQKVVAIGLPRSGEDAQLFTLDDLVKAAESNRSKATLTRDIRDRTLILDARMGGLSGDGLFDPQEKKTAATPHAEEAWEVAIGFRVRSIAPNAESPDADWHKPYLFDIRCDGEGNPLRQLRVERYKDATATEEERSLSPNQAQRLEEHEEWTACKAGELVNALGLAGDIGDAIMLAARLHDEGKKAAVWQRAFCADADGIYAKTKGPFLRNALGGYRHEFGSLAHVERHSAFRALSDDLKDLVLHLVAAHHGHARPVIVTEGCEGPPSVLEARARDVALRFARLQRRFGPWGLAWLEAVLRAADQKASRDLDEGRVPDG